MDMGAGMIVVMVVMMVIMMGGIGAGVLTFGRRRSRGSEQPGHEDPLNVLRDRYARGEISSEEYQERRGALEDSAGDHRP